MRPFNSKTEGAIKKILKEATRKIVSPSMYLVLSIPANLATERELQEIAIGLESDYCVVRVPGTLHQQKEKSLPHVILLAKTKTVLMDTWNSKIKPDLEKKGYGTDRAYSVWFDH